MTDPTPSDIAAKLANLADLAAADALARAAARAAAILLSKARQARAAADAFLQP